MQFIMDADTPEMREARIHNLEAAGLNRPDAELVDQKMKDVTLAVLKAMEDRITAFAEERPDLGPSLLVVTLEATHAAICGSRQQIRRHLMGMPSGFQIMEVDPEDIHNLMEALFGPTDSGRPH